MSADPFRDYTRRLRRELWQRFVLADRAVSEIRDHLLDLREACLHDGMSETDAERLAIERVGRVEVVAAALANGRYAPLERALVFSCAVTAAATTYLTLSLVLLGPPGAAVSQWLLIAGALLVQSAATAVVVAGAPRSPWLRLVAGAGGAALAFLGVWWVRATLSGPHFEGYLVVLGALVAAQGALTVVHVLHGGPAAAAAP